MTQPAQDCTWLAKQIRECCKSAGEPISDNQFMLIAGYTSIHAGLLNEMDPELFGIDGSDGQASQAISLGGEPIMPGDRVAFVAETHHRSMNFMKKFISDHYPAIESSGAGRVYLKTGASIHFLGKATVNRHNLRGMEFDKVLVHEEVPAHEITSLYAELQPGIKQ